MRALSGFSGVDTLWFHTVAVWPNVSATVQLLPEVKRTAPVMQGGSSKGAAELLPVLTSVAE